MTTAPPPAAPEADLASKEICCSNFNAEENDVTLVLEKARSLWIHAKRSSDLQAAEGMYRMVWKSFAKPPWSGKEDQQQTMCPNKRPRLEEAHDQDDATGDCQPFASDPSEIAGEKLVMLLLQNPDKNDNSTRAEEAQEILGKLGYTCRLARQVLNYPEASATDKHLTQVATKKSFISPPCRVFDSFLDSSELEILQRVFVDRQSAYWTDHDYTVEPPSPYVSYVIPLSEPGRELRRDYGFLGYLVQRILEQLHSWKPTLSQQCTHAELWAHNRPHATGHQLHFDSDNEGQGNLVRHPIVSTILYLSSSESESGTVGGPSIITNQRRVSRQLATQGWLCLPQLGRLTAFDGRVLHGVIPGKGVVDSPSSSDNDTVASEHRVTLMFAFWRRIQTRDHGSSKVGAARPFPPVSSTWADALCQPYQADSSEKRTEIKSVDPIPLSHVYETVGGEAWTSRMGMPSYDEIYQGF